MLGQFIFHTCNHAGLSLKALLRNSVRNGVLKGHEPNAEKMEVSLKIFHAGTPVFNEPNFCTISSGDYFEISESNCPILADNTREFTLVAYCKRGEGALYFPQEHQVIYSRKGESRTTSLVYDQLPIFVDSKFKPIILLAPKVWISNDVNTFISFTNGDDGADEVVETEWKIDFIAQNGEIIHTSRLSLKQKDVYILDVKATLIERLELTDQLQMINVVARGESTACVILTFLQNKKTGALALEHSLSPHYYMNGDFNRVRNEAFLFSE
jgi:hypothetical protein